MENVCVMISFRCRLTAAQGVFSDENNQSFALEPHEFCESACFQAGAIRRRFSQLAKKSLSQLL